MGVSKRPLVAGEVCEDTRAVDGMLPVHDVVVGEVKAELKAEKVEKKSTKKEEVEVTEETSTTEEAAE